MEIVAALSKSLFESLKKSLKVQTKITLIASAGKILTTHNTTVKRLKFTFL